LSLPMRKDLSFLKLGFFYNIPQTAVNWTLLHHPVGNWTWDRGKKTTMILWLMLLVWLTESFGCSWESHVLWTHHKSLIS
jgi:hypothetical protein